ncbi:C5a anaphylatoxin chemotactic receptor 1-like [Hyla sarda]|uniref:C5a anaphylatoxin chemotactic receptor 1-like n=1 Tax=Hyla sarda TaxID=327740 RepID=UPI0024C377CA|nr:C5a anaphylatoxin chemotactic receptor 1-like [Hyla sarda]
MQTMDSLMETEYANDSYDYEYDSNITTPLINHGTGKVSVVDWFSIFQYSLVVVLGIPGNGLVVWITAFEMKRTVNTLWFLNLAVADLLCCLSVPVNIMTLLTLGHWPLGLFACKFISSILIINMYASVFILTLISIDRCALVMKPVWCQNNRTLRKAYVACVVMWILAVILSSPVLIFRNIRERNGIEYCVLDYTLLRHHRQTVEDFIGLCRLLIGFVIPFLVIIGCYAMLIRWVKLRFTQNTKTIKVAIVVIIGFFVCWLPFHVAAVIIAMNSFSSPLYHRTKDNYNIFIGLAFMNSCINPIIYVLMGQDFKSKFKRSFKVTLKNVLEEDTNPSFDSNRSNLTSETKSTETSI